MTIDTCALEVGQHVRGEVTDLIFDYGMPPKREEIFINPTGTFELYVAESDGSLSCD